MDTDSRQHVPAFIRKQRAQQAAEFEITFRVQGKFPFPLQMLSEDQCFPATREDSMEILRSLTKNPENGVAVTLVHAGDEQWTPGHTWHASGYTVAPDPEAPTATAGATTTATTATPDTAKKGSN